MVSFWMYKYEVMDRSVGVVDYDVLEKIEDELPALSMCFMNPFLYKKLQAIDPNMNATIYLKYLTGDYYDEKMAKIDYDNVTLNLDDYFFYAQIKMRNNSNFMPKKLFPKHTVIFDGIYYERFSKCFAADMGKNELSNVEQIRFYYNSVQLIKDITGGRFSVMHQMSTNFFYPGQFLLEFTSPQLEDIGFTKQSRTEWTITSIEYLRRRNSRNHKCMTEWKRFDEIVGKEHMKRIGCRAPYGRANQLLKSCDNKEDINKATIHYSNIWKNYFPKACHRISKISIDQKNIRSSMRSLQIDIKYPEDVKTITQSQEVDGHTLIGNIGGYIGLFLGNVIFQSSVFSFFSNLYEIISYILLIII